ncbi:hypothetical protein [Motiliproteus sp. MSK22-1]|uniref:hypothetical protein n=1 Tax=Motiliproteus sp. MSK22-1 TaxID=1897630 RepID=UPI0009772220|nr:hypothetical protein [Motiliproteus sp. MSK22-1]OMH25849.1 hypothetical protein BGP75_25375 [Motiliproteus sp. MSK22-1]
MHIPTYVLAVKKPLGELKLAKGRRSPFDLPVCFDEKYANFLFEFCESRVCCDENDEIQLLKGNFDISDIDQDHLFVDSFKNKLKEVQDFSRWQLVKCKKATSEYSDDYRKRLSLHLKERQSLFQRRVEKEASVA